MHEHGVFDFDFAVRYAKAIPFTITEVYTPTGSSTNDPSRGLYTKRAKVPGGKLLELPSVVVDARPGESFTIFSCLEPLPGVLPPVVELVFATRQREVNDSFVSERVAFAQRMGVPINYDDVLRVDRKGCP